MMQTIYRRLAAVTLAFYIALLLLTQLAFIPTTTIHAEAFANPNFEKLWNRTDKPVKDGRTARSWLWGQEAFASTTEDYAEAPDGKRLVQYFDKTRMELTNPAGNSRDPFYITNGLLVKEMMSGQLQVGNAVFRNVGPAWIGVAGDPDDVLGLTYANLNALANEAALPVGTTITATATRFSRFGGTTPGVSDILASYNVKAAQYVPETRHTIASIFLDFLNSKGLIYDDTGKAVDGQIFNPTFYATGYPVTESYWTKSKVAGQVKDVLVQGFERRVLTYTPSNPAGFKVEMGNVGQHYYGWRYGNQSPFATGMFFQELFFYLKEFSIDPYNPQDLYSLAWNTAKIQLSRLGLAPPDAAPVISGSTDEDLYASFAASWRSLISVSKADTRQARLAAYEAAFAIGDRLDDPHTVFIPGTQNLLAALQTGRAVNGYDFYLQANPDSKKGPQARIFSAPVKDANGIWDRAEVVAVDDQNTVGLSRAELALLQEDFNNRANITLTLRKPDGSTTTVSVSKTSVKPFTITTQTLPGNIGYVFVNTMNQPGYNDELTAALRSFSGTSGLIIDLRNVSGGRPEKLLSLLSAKVKNVFYLTYQDGRTEVVPRIGPSLSNLPTLVMLVNGNSRSANEIAAQAVKEYKLGTVIGQTTAGAWAAAYVPQVYTDEARPTFEVKTAKVLSPLNKLDLNEIGVTPDIAVEMSEADRAAGNDKILQRALDFLQKGS